MEELLRTLKARLAECQSEIEDCELAGYDWTLTLEKGRRCGLNEAIDAIESANLMVVPE